VFAVGTACVVVADAAFVRLVALVVPVRVTDPASRLALTRAELFGTVTNVAVKVATVAAVSLTAAVSKTSGITTVEPTTALPSAGVIVPRDVVYVNTAAFEGATDNIPKPNEATATSATRLKVVFVDICFLSFSRDRESPDLGFG
jgi:hypothetical protein